MLTKNQIYETVITDYTHEGQGVAHIEGCAVFIPNAVAGEKVKVRIETAKKTWAASMPPCRTVWNSSFGLAKFFTSL